MFAQVSLCPEVELRFVPDLCQIDVRLNRVWPAVIAAVAALSGVALGALMEPVRLRYARQEHARQDRLGQATRLLEAANQATAVWATIFRLLDSVGPHKLVAERWNAMFATLETTRNEVRAAAGLLTLYGPETLAAAACAVADADSQLSKTGAEFGRTAVITGNTPPGVINKMVTEANPQLDQLVRAIDAFVVTARDHAR
jgi:hypothetical protein